MSADEFKKLLGKISQDSPLYEAARDLLHEIASDSELQMHETESDLANFDKIYERRLRHLESKNISFKGIRETIAIAREYSGKVKSISFTTRNFDGFAITNIDCTKIVGLLYIVRETERA
jgi:hypothetical protein